MKIEIKSIFGKLLFEGNFSCIADAVKAAIKAKADLSYANLRYADLRSANLRYADLRSANLRSADLSYADLSSAKNLPTIQVVPIRQMVLKSIKANGNKLDMDHWHTCKTTHCDAGWIVTLHPEGRVLESIFGTSGAAALILNACGSPIPSFTASNEEAMAHIVEQAGLERERMGRLEDLMPELMKKKSVKKVKVSE